MTNEERRAALEAIIYAADEPATVEQLAKALGEEKLVVQASLDELTASYAVEERGIEIRCVAGGYKMYTKPQQHDVVRRFIKSLRPPLRLTMPALETLAVIAYKQPVTAPEISEIRGVNTSGVISTLLDKRLITTAGRKEVIGRPILYKTSKEFLMRFGLSDLEELPSLKEFEALAREALGTDEGVASPEGTSDEAEVASGEWRVASENQGHGTAAEANGQPEDGRPIEDWRSQEDAAEGGYALKHALTSTPAVGSAQAEPDMIATGQELVVEGHQPVTEGKQMTTGEEESRDETNTTNAPTERGESTNSVPSAHGDSRSTPSETLERVKQELAAAEEWREHEALATAEGMPAGELDEDPLPPSVKSTAAGE
jgi:segregation and condensation protein B